MTTAEFKNEANILINHALRVKPSDKVMILSDFRTVEQSASKALISAFIYELQSVGADCTVDLCNPRLLPHQPIPAQMAETLKACDIVINLSVHNMLYHDGAAMREAVSNGTRIVLLPRTVHIGYDFDKSHRMMPNNEEDFYKIVELTQKVQNKIKGGGKIRMTNAAGSDITFTIGTLSFSFTSNLCLDPHFYLYPGGQCAIGIDEGTANGKIVIDANIQPILRMLNEPIEFIVKDGYITEVNGGPDAMEYKRAAESVGDPGAFCVAEFGLGMNHLARGWGKPYLDEMEIGAVHYGIGSNKNFGGSVEANKWHTDGVLPNSSVWFNDELILDNGKYLL